MTCLRIDLDTPRPAENFDAKSKKFRFAAPNL